MSRIRANKITNKAGTGAIELEKGAHLPIGMGITGAGGLNITGVVTTGNIKVGSGVTIESNGQATFVGVVTFGSGSTTIDNNVVNVGTALTLGHTQGLQFHTQNLHSAGFEVNQINASGIITASSLSVSGNISVGGTLTYEDVTNIDSVGLITARGGISIPDSQVLNIGTGNDLQLSHDSNNSYIKDAGTGSLFITASVLKIANPAVNENIAVFKPDDQVELYFNNTKRLTTTSAGAAIVGVCSATSFSGSGANLTSIPAGNLTGALPAISGANLTGIEGGKVRGYKYSQDSGYSASSWSSFTQVASFSYTPVATDSKIIVFASMNLLWENSNVHNSRMKFGSNSYQQFDKSAKAASISGWLSGNPCIIFDLGTSGNTSSNSVILELQGNGSHSSYFNYSSGDSAFLLLEMAP